MTATHIITGNGKRLAFKHYTANGNAVFEDLDGPKGLTICPMKPEFVLPYCDNRSLIKENMNAR